MGEVILVIVSSLYLISLALVDGLFNRLIFRNRRKLPHFSRFKQKIYRRREWRAIGLLYLIFLPIVLPSIVTYALGGLSYLIIYLVTLLIIPWDVIFGIQVFDDFFGDRPSIALPYFGWVTTTLKHISVARLSLATLLIFVKITLNI